MFKKIKKYVFLITPLLLALAINIYFRSFPVYFPQLKDRAKEVIYQMALQRIGQDVYTRFSQFNPLAKDKLIKTRFAEYKKANDKAIDEQAQEGYKQFKKRFQDETGQTYLMELDCWHWARYVDNVVKFGHPGDRVEKGKQVDAFMLAPLGSPMHWEHFVYYFSAFLFKIFSLFKHVPLFTFLFYIPLLLSAISIILLYLFVRRYSGHIAAITSCMVMGLSGIVLQRSCAGWFKKEVVCLIFPILVIWAYIASGNARNFKTKSLWILLSSFWVGLFCYSWTHWWIIFVIMVIYEALFIVCLFFAHAYLKKENFNAIKEHFIQLAMFVGFSFFWVFVLSGLEPIQSLFSQLTQSLMLNKPLIASIWPNVYSTVGELRSMGIKEIANSLSGMPVFVLSILSFPAIFIIAILNKSYVGTKRSIVFILSLWTVAILFASTRGIRFVLFLPFSLGIFLGMFIDEIYRFFKAKRNYWAVALVLTGFLIINWQVITRANAAARSIYPLMDNTWYKVLNLIKEKTPEGTIVNSWWDFGDWFKAAARRPTIFDGQSQDTPQAYWMARAILSGNEDEAVGILRMLNNGGNKAFELIDGYLKDPLQSVLLLENILGSGPQRSQDVLKNFLPPVLIQEVMKLLYNTPGKACFVVDNSMIPKMAAISYLGTWDFSKIYIAQNFNKQEKEQIMEHLKGLGRNIEDAQRYYQEAFLIKPNNLDDWLSHRVLFYSELSSGKEKDGIVTFDNGFTYNTKDQSISSNAGQVPRSLFVLLGNNFVEINNPKPNVIFSLLVVKQQEGYKCIFLDRELANSMFVRLYFFRGLGLKHFSPLIDAEEGNNYIRVLNINW
jgi:dolichyl-phosphooligosaccharide-protein glycotransferase